MIYLTTEQAKKIELLDKLFGALDIAQLTEVTESEQIVAKLKGTENNPGILDSLLKEHSSMMINVSMLQNDVMSMKSDIQILIKALDRPYDSSNQSHFNSLKNRHGIY